MGKYKHPMLKVLDVSEEKDPEITKAFCENSIPGDVFLSIIAPYVGVKISPSKEVMASIGISEEFGVETAIEQIMECGTNCKTLYLLLNSPGGLVTSSYKVARA
ncbi:MAG: hypothetical protein JW931_00035 [Methanomicrobiaceae archaeon]|nr:hypothetical protein [Methanomicrobiaceae archaeon]